VSLEQKKYFDSGKRAGMYECFEITSDTIHTLRRSLEDVWLIEQEESSYPPKPNNQVPKLLFAINTLEVLAEIFQNNYSTAMDSMGISDDE
jgi:hypothetical protein